MVVLVKCSYKKYDATKLVKIPKNQNSVLINHEIFNVGGRLK